MVELVWLVPLLPLVGFALLLLAGTRLGEPGAGWLATFATAASFVVAVVVFIGLLDAPEHTYEHSFFTWIPAGQFHVDVNLLVDPLSIAMVLFITGIGALIHLYSIGYMHGDPRYEKFFLYLNLFIFSMLMLVLGGNLLITFLGWEGVGACSYFLISFWFENPTNAAAGKKAFVTNRVGDWGFMVAMFFVFLTFGTLNYTGFLAQVPGAQQSVVSAIAVLLFIGAVGKSAQIPLFVWLPDAMAGPTPVSALIHAATMVTAGVYLMCRVSPVLGYSSGWVPLLIAWVGALTALVAATIAMAQVDIKRVLAFSTISQLGYMFLAIGVGAYWVAIFHMITHAFFKAAMFLGAGSVIHGMDGEQDMRRMGRLKAYMGITTITFILAWLAIAGVPPFSGFWSKDEILGSAFSRGDVHGYLLYAIGLLTALITAYYMSRLVFRTFFGEEKWPIVPAPETADQPLAVALAAATDEQQQAALAAVPDLTVPADPEPAHSLGLGPDYHPHESPWTMTVPLIVLGVLSLVGGLLDIPFLSMDYLERWLEPVFAAANPIVNTAGNVEILELLAVGSAASIVGIAVGWVLFGRRPPVQRALEPAPLVHAWYYDSTIARFMGGPGRAIFNGAAWFDRVVIDGVVNGVGVVAIGSASLLRRVQGGYVRRYALGIALGTLVLLGFMVTRVLIT
jgi:NADH-quinone oxidoreductase subunit L